MENRRILKKEGLNLKFSSNTDNDQKVLEVSENLPENAKVEDKKDFESFKELYKGTIDNKCIETYGNCDDKKLWEDTAKEMYLKSANYVPDDSKKADGELVRENKRIIKHNKVMETKNSKNKKLNEEIVEFNDPDEVAEVFVKISKLSSEIEDLWDGINPTDKGRIDDEFSTSISNLIRWLNTDINDILDNELYEYKSVYKLKECSKQG